MGYGIDCHANFALAAEFLRPPKSLEPKCLRLEVAGPCESRGRCGRDGRRPKGAQLPEKTMQSLCKIDIDFT